MDNFSVNNATSNSLPLCTYSYDFYNKNKKLYSNNYKKVLVLLFGIILATIIYIALFIK